jgi:hypothetical protein
MTTEDRYALSVGSLPSHPSTGTSFLVYAKPAAARQTSATGRASVDDHADVVGGGLRIRFTVPFLGVVTS